MRIIWLLVAVAITLALPQQAYNPGSLPTSTHAQQRTTTSLPQRPEKPYNGPFASSVPAGVNGQIIPVGNTKEVNDATNAFFEAYKKMLHAVSGVDFNIGDNVYKENQLSAAQSNVISQLKAPQHNTNVQQSVAQSNINRSPRIPQHIINVQQSVAQSNANRRHRIPQHNTNVQQRVAPTYHEEHHRQPAITHQVNVRPRSSARVIASYDFGDYHEINTQKAKQQLHRPRRQRESVSQAVSYPEAVYQNPQQQIGVHHERFHERGVLQGTNYQEGNCQTVYQTDPFQPKAVYQEKSHQDTGLEDPFQPKAVYQEKSQDTGLEYTNYLSDVYPDVKQQKLLRNSRVKNETPTIAAYTLLGETPEVIAAKAKFFKLYAEHAALAAAAPDDPVEY